MTLSEVRSQNIKKVTEVALKHFSKYGIDNTKVIDIAKEACLTERSIYRYFDTKADIVKAALIYFWETKLDEYQKSWNKIEDSKLNGKEKCLKILYNYADIFIDCTKELVFIQEAEAYLYRFKLDTNKEFGDISPFIYDKTPLKSAIELGVKDGSIDSTKELEYFYSNSFDAILGLLQKLSNNTYDDIEERSIRVKRVNKLCDALVESIAK